MRTSLRLLSFGLVPLLALVVLSRAPAAAGADDGRTYRVAAGDGPVLLVYNALGRFEVSKQGRRVSVTFEGKRLPTRDVRRSGRAYQVFDAVDRQILLFGVFAGPGDGQIVYSPHLDPYALQGRTGLDVVELDYSEVRDLLLDGVPEKILRVRKVAQGSASARAGLRSGQLVLACNGQRLDGESSLYGCFARATTGLDLEVFDSGSRRHIQLPLPGTEGWIAVQQAERLFADALGR